MIRFVIKDIKDYLSEYRFQAIYVGMILMSIRCLFCILSLGLNGKHICKKRIIVWFIKLIKDFSFGFYLYMVVAITFLSRKDGSVNVFNLELFSTFSDGLQSWIYIVENILMFLPLGIFLYLYGVRSMGITLIISVISSISIEYSQYITARGKVEIDDIVTNVMGALIGFIVIKIGCTVVGLVSRRL